MMTGMYEPLGRRGLPKVEGLFFTDFICSEGTRQPQNLKSVGSNAMKWIMAAFAVGIILGGCSINPSEITDSMAGKYADKLTYIHDARTGLCFAIIASRRTGSTDQSGLGITEVSCGACVHLIKGLSKPPATPTGVFVDD